MAQLINLFLLIGIVMCALIFGGIYAEQISTVIRQRIPNFDYDGDTFLLRGLLGLCLIAFGLVVVYLLTRP